MDDSSQNEYPIIYWFGIGSGIIILLLNAPILRMIWREQNWTWINQVIGVDCLLCLCMIPIILDTAGVYPLPCSFITSYAFFASLLNRLLPVGIVIYRYIYVCKSSWVPDADKRSNLEVALSTSILAITLGLTFGSWVYQDKYIKFLNCLGKQNILFQFDQEMTGWAFDLPIYHPFHALTTIAFFTFSVLVPAGYFLIYRFRKRDNYYVHGLNERSRLIRRHKNIVSTQVNMVNWIIEMSGFIIVVIPGGNSFSILYFLLTCTISPALYYAGIVRTRNADKTRLLAVFRECKQGADRRRSILLVRERN